MGGRLKTSQLKTSRVALGARNLPKKFKHSGPSRRTPFLFYRFPIFPFSVSFASSSLRIIQYDTRAFKISTLNDRRNFRYRFDLGFHYWANI